VKKIQIVRDWQDKNQTLGKCTVFDENGKPLFNSLSLERGERNNEPRVSCIPTGTYDVVLEWSPRFNTKLWEIKGVENRSECKFHAANYWYQLNGCVALGSRLFDIDGDGYHDVTNSKNTMRAFHTALKGQDKAVLEIVYSSACRCL